MERGRGPEGDPKGMQGVKEDPVRTSYCFTWRPWRAWRGRVSSPSPLCTEAVLIAMAAVTGDEGFFGVRGGGAGGGGQGLLAHQPPPPPATAAATGDPQPLK